MKYHKRQKIYITGKITDNACLETYKKFSAIEEMLKLLGHEVVNPLKIIPKNESWENKMLISFYVMHKCNAIYYLPDWKESKDAKLVYKFANKLGLRSINNCIINTIQSKIEIAEKKL